MSVKDVNINEVLNMNSLDDKVEQTNISICLKYNTMQKESYGIKYCSLENDKFKCQYIGEVKVQVLVGDKYKLRYICEKV